MRTRSWLVRLVEVFVSLGISFEASAIIGVPRAFYVSRFNRIEHIDHRNIDWRLRLNPIDPKSCVSFAFFAVASLAISKICAPVAVDQIPNYASLGIICCMDSSQLCYLLASVFSLMGIVPDQTYCGDQKKESFRATAVA